MIKPITPEEIQEEATMPDAVITVVNDLIRIHWDGDQAVILQKDIVSTLMDEMKITRKEIFDKKYLNIEATYKKAGWTVSYDKPGYNESYQPSFTFKPTYVPLESYGREKVKEE